ncbi:MAG: hypothetical protein HW377_2778, partial [Actinobacteria bacterium]|nr:hypothetical protein [Actinomycetota bacterium]
MKLDDIKQLENQIKTWESNELAAFIKRQPEHKSEFLTYGGFPQKRVYT